MAWPWHGQARKGVFMLLIELTGREVPARCWRSDSRLDRCRAMWSPCRLEWAWISLAQTAAAPIVWGSRKATQKAKSQCRRPTAFGPPHDTTRLVLHPMTFYIMRKLCCDVRHEFQNGRVMRQSHRGLLDVLERQQVSKKLSGILESCS